MMFCTRNRRNDVEGGPEDTTGISTSMSMPGGPAQSRHEDIGMDNRNSSPRQYPEKSHKQRQDFDDGAHDLWSLYGKEAKIYDETWTKALESNIGGALIFAGLFSAILTAFIVLKIQDLKVNPADQSVYYQNQTVHMLDRISQQLASMGNQVSTESNPPLPYPAFHPSASDRRVNIFWFLSLVSSLVGACLATLVQQWSKDYSYIFQYTSKSLHFSRFRSFLLGDSELLPALVETVIGLIHISLFLFFMGLGEMIWNIDKDVFRAFVVPIVYFVSLYLGFTLIPIVNPRKPHRTPFSSFIWLLTQNLSYRLPHGPMGIVKYLGQSSMQGTKSRMNRDVRAIQWLIDRIDGSDEMHALVLAIPGSFNVQWGRDVWKGVVGVQTTSLANFQARSHPGFSSAPEGTAVYELYRRLRYFFETYKDEGNFMDAGIESTRRMHGYIETTACLVCCAGVKLVSFGKVGEALGEVGDKVRTNNLLSIGSNPLFTVRWTCLSLAAVNRMVNDNRVKELAKLALDGITPFQTYLGSRDTVPMAVTAAQKMDDDLKEAWEAVLDLRLALEPWTQNQNRTVSETRSILSTCEVSIQKLERIAVEAIGMEGIDWRIRCLQETMDEVTRKLTRRLPGVFFDTLHSTAITMTRDASDQPSVQAAPIPQFIFPERQLQNIYILGQILRDIIEKPNTEWDEETLESLKYLRDVPIPLCGLNHLMERQIWRLQDLRDGGGLGFTIELFFFALRQLLSTSQSPDKSSFESSSGLKKAFYIGTFNVIASDWRMCRHSAGTQRILLDILCDIIIQGRGVFSDFLYPQYIVGMLLELVGKMVEGLGESGPQPHIDDLLDELKDESIVNCTDIDLRDKVLNMIHRSLYTASS